MVICGYLSCRRGVCQGDPLSPFFFCLAEEVLSCGISFLVEQQKILPMANPKKFATPHILCANGFFIFCRGTKKGLDSLMNLLRLYGDASGQIINLENCQFFDGSLSNRKVIAIKSQLSFPMRSIPFPYLGIPIFEGKPCSSHLRPIADCIKLKLLSWKGSLISIMGCA